MQFGMFMEFGIRSGGSQASAFKEGFDLVDAAESWGLDGAWLAELHFNPTRSVLSSPITIASSIATRTKRMRIGMAVYVLPLNNPLRVAEEVATVDHISEGRFEFGIGRSGFARAYDMYGIDYHGSRQRPDPDRLHEFPFFLTVCCFRYHACKELPLCWSGSFDA